MRSTWQNARVADMLQTSEQLKRLAFDLHVLASDMAEPSRCISRGERLIGEGERERIAAEVHATVRGK